MFMYAEIVLVKNIMSNTIQGVIDTIEEGEAVVWSTWKELLLAFAVKRHGLKDWDTVATELRNRHYHRGGNGSSLPPSAAFTAEICKDRYRNLKRRFSNNHQHDGSNEGRGAGSSENDDESKFESDDDNEHDGGIGGGGDDAFPWLEELRKLRMAELRQEVHRYDASIRSLQIKVKTMEEERENNLKADRNDDVRQREPDLDNEEVKREGSENDITANNGDKDMPPSKVAGKSVSGSAGNDEDISFNESNSAENKGAFWKTEPVEKKPDPNLKPISVGGEDSCNDSSDRHEVYKKKRKITQEKEKEKNVGRSDSEGTKESSDVQSSASLLTSRRKTEKGDHDGGGRDRIGSTDPPVKPEREKSGGYGELEPSAAFSVLDKIRGHKHGSVFERRLQIQKTEKYKKMVRRHVDLETIQSRIDDGSYSSFPDKFYVDLLLLFNNAIVFFPKTSSQSEAAQELRELVMKEMKKKNNSNKASSSSESHRTVVKPEVKPERSDSLLPINKPANHPIVVVCRKRSSISSAKPSTSMAANKVEKQKENEKPVDEEDSKPVKSPPLSISNEEEDSQKLKVKDKLVTGTRSMRRGSQGRTNVGSKTEPSSNISSIKSLNSPQQHGVAKDKGDNKKKSEAAAPIKKSSAADFLKRMKKNSPTKGTEASESSKDNNSKGGKKDQQQRKKKLDEGNDGPARRGGGGGGSNGGSAGGKKQIKEVNRTSKKNTGRPTRKGKEIVASGKKRGRDGDGEGSSQRAKKRAR